MAYHEISMVSATSDTMALFQIGPESELVRVQHVLASNGERVAFFDTICPAGYVDDVRLLRDEWLVAL